MSALATVRFEQVSKVYRSEKRPSVHDFNLQVADGEFLVLVGPSGCGKTTTLRMLSGLEDVTRGSIFIGDHFVNYTSPKHRDIAMVFQNYALYPSLTVYENMALGLKLRKTPKYLVEERVKKAARMLEISSMLDRRPDQLSGGQKQRVALGRAIVREPQVFLMDEPLSNLDAKLRMQTRAELISLHQALRTTTIYVTHDQIEAMTMSTRIVVMRDGLIQQVGTPMEIYRRPRNVFVAGFIGSPPMNLIRGRIVRRNDALYFDNDWMALPVHETHRAALAEAAGRNAEVYLGVRPEHLLSEPEAVARQPAHSRVMGTVLIREELGSDEYLHLRIGHGNVQRVISRVSESAVEYRVEDTLPIACRMERVRYFAFATGEEIPTPDPVGADG